MLDAARRISGRDIPATMADRRPGDPARLVASAARAREALGWNARNSDVDTLVRTSWEAYRQLLD
jgi:UDP-glucose 4-epimerase